MARVWGGEEQVVYASQDPKDYRFSIRAVGQREVLEVQHIGTGRALGAAGRGVGEWDWQAMPVQDAPESGGGRELIRGRDEGYLAAQLSVATSDELRAKLLGQGVEVNTLHLERLHDLDNALEQATITPAEAQLYADTVIGPEAATHGQVLPEYDDQQPVVEKWQAEVPAKVREIGQRIKATIGSSGQRPEYAVYAGAEDITVDVNPDEVISRVSVARASLPGRGGLHPRNHVVTGWVKEHFETTVPHQYGLEGDEKTQYIAERIGVIENYVQDRYGRDVTVQPAEEGMYQVGFSFQVDHAPTKTAAVDAAWAVQRAAQFYEEMDPGIYGSPNFEQALRAELNVYDEALRKEAEAQRQIEQQQMNDMQQNMGGPAGPGMG